MPRKKGRSRLLIYSHDCYGLGHLRRCMTIANSLVDHRGDLSVLIISGSPVAGSFEFQDRVDFTRIPGVIKERKGGRLRALKLDMSIEEILRIRSKLITQTAESFEPDLFLVDHQPLGLRNEAEDALRILKKNGAKLILGYRDIPNVDGTAEPWEFRDEERIVKDLYDNVWVFGLSSIYDPIAEKKMSQDIIDKTRFTGYLRRTYSPVDAINSRMNPVPIIGDHPYILAITGGGGDGDGLVDWVLRAYEYDSEIPYSTYILMGPFMNTNLQEEFVERIERINIASKKIHAMSFHPNVESLYTGAVGVVAMGGYNIFCEILSFDKQSIIIPRTIPGKEQFTRAKRASDLGLTRMLIDDGKRDPKVMATRLRELPHQSKPSDIRLPGLLDGLSNIDAVVDAWLSSPVIPAEKLAVVK
jgi:predicted glycosyltransferase